MTEPIEITLYERFAVEYRDSSHRYWLLHDGQRTPVVSVTSALRIIDKPQLVRWAERQGVEGVLALEREGKLDGIAIEDAAWKMRDLGIGADAKKDAGGKRGSAIHEALRLYCEEGKPPKVSEFDLQERGYVQGLCKWLLDFSPEPILTERIVGSLEHGFAGRFDLLADIKGQRFLCDLKTSARAYPEMSLQLAAYVLALEECYGQDSPEAEVSQGLIVLISANGTYSTHPGCADPADFLEVLGCHHAVRRVKAAMSALEQERVAA